MTLNEKLLNTRVLELIKIYIWYIANFCMWESVSKHYSQSLESHRLHETICETCGFRTTLF